MADDLISRPKVLEILRRAFRWGNDSDDAVTDALKKCICQIENLPPPWAIVVDEKNPPGRLIDISGGEGLSSVQITDAHFAKTADLLPKHVQKYGRGTRAEPPSLPLPADPQELIGATAVIHVEPPSVRLARIAKDLRALTPEQRLEALGNWCPHCGGQAHPYPNQPSKVCQCWNDE